MSMPSRRSDPADASLANRFPVAAYVAVTLAFSWLAWTVGFVATDDPVLATVSVVIGGFGPAVGAVAVRWRRGQAVRAWLREILVVRVPVRWYLLALAIPLFFVTVEVAYVALTASGVLEPTIVVDRLPMYLGGLLFVALFGGGQEEFGWRGFMLPELQDRYGGLVASLAVGVVWAGWHLPLFTLPGALYADDPFVTYVPVVVAFSVVFTWLYNRSGRSLPVVILLHAGINSADALVPVSQSVLPDILGGSTGHLLKLGATLLVVAAVLLVANRRRLGLRSEPAAVDTSDSRASGYGD